MGRRLTTILTAAGGLILAALLAFQLFRYYDRSQSAGIALPDPLPSVLPSGGMIPLPGAPQESLVAVSVDRDNVSAILSTLTPLQSFSRTIRVVWYYDNASHTQTVEWYARNGLVRTTLTGSGDSRQNRLLDGSTLYTWMEGSRAYTAGELRGMTFCDLLGLPEWEDLLNEDYAEILSAVYNVSMGSNVLMLETREPYYNGLYVISMDTGLLMRATFLDHNGERAMTFDAGTPRLEPPGDSTFTLPDGELIS